MAPKTSVAWDHFEDKGDYVAECKMCKTNISFKSGVSNLTKHIQRKHPTINIVTHETDQHDKNPLNESSDEEIKPQLLMPKKEKTSKRSIAWDYFVKKCDGVAACTICHMDISFRSGVSNLTKHVQRKHKLALNSVTQEIEPEQEQYLQESLDEETKPQNCPPSSPLVEYEIVIKNKTSNRSVAWDYFEDKGNYIGECNICSANISFKSGVSNLTKHVRRKHNLATNSETQETELEQEQYLQDSSDEEIMSEQSPQPSNPQTAHSTSIEKKPKRSVAWKYFVDKGNYMAECNMCTTNISFKSGVSNLTKHVQRCKNKMLEMQETELEQVQYLQDSSDEEIMLQQSPKPTTPETMHVVKTPKRSAAWKYFVDKGNYIGQCNICKSNISYKSSVSNLSKHIQRCKSKKIVAQETETLDEQLLQDSSDEEMLQPMTSEIVDTNTNMFISEFLRFDCNKTKKGKSKTSVAWDYFIDKGNNIAECNICKTNISFKSGVSNLVKHFQRKHSTLDLEAQEIEPQQEESLGDSFDEDIRPQQLPQTDPTSLGSGTNPYITHLLRRDYSKIKKEIEDHIMNLFIWDKQPFTIVEDKGFRALLNFMVPNYVVPKRKYFACTLLTRQYEEVKTSTKAAVNEDAETICLTTDIWASKTSDSYLAVMGHYIDKNFVLQSVLLECKLLGSNQTGQYLADELQSIVRDWNISDKVLLVISDNDANIKDAITILQWKHFVGYTHTLNIAVQKALGSHALLEVLNKVKAVISNTQLRESNLTWSKLKKYQELADTDEATKWNSTLYLLQGFVGLKDEINSALNDADETSETFTSYEWGICESLIVVLKPCEEVLNQMSDQKYVSGSSVLPITVALTNALEEIVDPLFPDEVENCRDDLLTEVTTRFSNVENSKTFTTSTFLDPRYKLYFGNPAIAELTKRHVIGLLTAMIDEESVASTSTPQEELESAEKSQSLLWSHYNKKMQNLRLAGTADGRATIEVERYLDDKVLSPDMNPLDWWRSNQAIYPYLAKLARSKLNSMAISVPCQHLFSAAWNITERNDRTASCKVQQMFFLQQNKKRRSNIK